MASSSELNHARNSGKRVCPTSTTSEHAIKTSVAVIQALASPTAGNAGLHALSNMRYVSKQVQLAVCHSKAPQKQPDIGPQLVALLCHTY